MTYTWPDAKRIAKGTVSDWMHLEADERRMESLVDLIQIELERAFANGVRASEAATLERAAKVAEEYPCSASSALPGAGDQIAAAIRALKE